MEIRGLISKIDAIQAEAAYQSPTGHNPAGYDEPYSFAHDNKTEKTADTNVNDNKVNEIIQQLNNVMQKMQDTVALKSIKESSGIAYQLIESFGYTLEATAPAASPSALGTIGSGLGRTLGRALPGVGAYLGFSNAYERAKAGDWSGAGLAGLSGALSLVPGIGWVAATIPQAGLMAKDYFSGSDEEEPEDTTQSTKPVDPKLADIIKNKSNKDPSVNQLVHRSQEKTPSTPNQSTDQNQKTVKDPQKFEKLKAQLGVTAPGDKITPEIQEKIKAFQQQKGITVDGLPGPQTYAAAGISESLSDQLRNLLNMLSEQEADSTTSSNQEPILFDKNNKKYALLPDGRLIDEQGYLIDGNKSDLPRISDQPVIAENINEGLVDIFSKAYTGARNFVRGFQSAGATGSRVGQLNPVKNAPGTSGHGTRIASPSVSRAHKAGKFVGQHPKSIAAGGAAAATAGTLGYDAMTSSNAPQTQVAKPTTQTPTTQTAPAGQSKSQTSAAKSSAGQGKSKIDRELQAIADEAKVLINTASKYPDATVKNAIEKLDTYLSTIPNIKWTAASWL